jgi:hypothetical protein
VLSLEEIRRRKRSREPAVLAKSLEVEGRLDKENGFLKDAIKVLDELRAANSDKEVERTTEKRKRRSFGEVKSEEDAKRSRTQVEGTQRVPPVRLKRTRRCSVSKVEAERPVVGDEGERLEVVVEEEEEEEDEEEAGAATAAVGRSEALRQQHRRQSVQRRRRREEQEFGREPRLHCQELNDVQRRPEARQAGAAHPRHCLGRHPQRHRRPIDGGREFLRVRRAFSGYSNSACTYFICVEGLLRKLGTCNFRGGDGSARTLLASRSHS